MMFSNIKVFIVGIISTIIMIGGLLLKFKSNRVDDLEEDLEQTKRDLVTQEHKNERDVMVHVAKEEILDDVILEKEKAKEELSHFENEVEKEIERGGINEKFTITV